jgi:electron transfer flavoprotein alpha subunit
MKAQSGEAPRNLDAFEGVWILAEQSGGRILPVSYELLGRGRALAGKLNTDLTAVLMGSGIGDEALNELIRRGADRVLFVDAPALAEFLVEPFAACLRWLIAERGPEILIAAATSTGRTVMPYAAIGADAGLTADCTELDVEPETGNLLQTRPAIGGNILATIKTPAHRPQMATVRPHSSAPAEPRADRTGEIERLAPPEPCLQSRVRRVEFRPDEEDHPLQDAETVVAAGRGIKKAENVELIGRLAAALGAAVAASRDVVDRGWMSYPHQVGLSGKTVTPRLYVGVGVSGSIQHLAGMQTSETIVAINSDPEAQIFRVADFGIVADLFEAVPRLIERLNPPAD